MATLTGFEIGEEEAMSADSVQRIVTPEPGGSVAGELVVYDPDLESGEIERIDCTRFGSGAYSIPSSVEQLSFDGALSTRPRGNVKLSWNRMEGRSATRYDETRSNSKGFFLNCRVCV